MVRWVKAWDFNEVDSVGDDDSDSMKSRTIWTSSSSSKQAMSLTSMVYRESTERDNDKMDLGKQAIG